MQVDTTPRFAEIWLGRLPRDRSPGVIHPMLVIAAVSGGRYHCVFGTSNPDFFGRTTSFEADPARWPDCGLLRKTAFDANRSGYPLRRNLIRRVGVIPSAHHDRLYSVLEHARSADRRTLNPTLANSGALMTSRALWA